MKCWYCSTVAREIRQRACEEVTRKGATSKSLTYRDDGTCNFSVEIIVNEQKRSRVRGFIKSHDAECNFILREKLQLSKNGVSTLFSLKFQNV